MLKIFQSSIDPDKLSLTIKGIILAVFGVAASIGMNVTIGDGGELAQAISLSIKSLVGFFSSIMVLWGVIRKIWVKIKANEGE